MKMIGITLKEQFSIFLVISFALILGTDAGLIKNIFQKVTGIGGNKTEDAVKESAPICGNNIFATANENAVSPEIIFITNRASRTVQSNEYGNKTDRDGEKSKPRRGHDVSEVANEFRFNAENVTLEELERNGFNPDAPVTFLMHGFTSGYPLQAWMSAIVEAYTIDRETGSGGSSHHNSGGHHNDGDSHNNGNHYDSENNHGSTGGLNQQYGSNNRDESQARRGNSHDNGGRMNHNLFIINWNYGARGINYPRAVANIPLVATFVTRFINERLLGDARIDASRIQLIGHSLGAHLAGFIGKNTRSKVGRIYGLDPAGPCFGSISGPLYPASKRLAPSDAQEVITLHTNTALLGINKPLGKYSVFVEGGSVQPGCKGGGVLGSLNTLTLDGGSFDTIACSHSRAPNLLTYRHDQSDTQDDCQLVAFECKDWESYLAGHCGYCSQAPTASNPSSESSSGQIGPLKPVECLRVGLDWQYPKKGAPSGGHQSGYTTDRNPYNSQSTTGRPYGQYNSTYQTTPGYGQTRDDENRRKQEGGGWIPSSSSRRPTSSGHDNSRDVEYDRPNEGHGASTRRPSSFTSSSYDNSRDQDPSAGGARSSTTRGPWSLNGGSYQSTSGYNDYSRDSQRGREQDSYSRNPTRRPNSFGSDSSQRERRFADGSANTASERRRDSGESSSTKSMFLKTGDTQPYCAYQYQVVLELNEPFPKKKPPISLVLQDSDSRHELDGAEHGRGQQQRAKDKEQNSLTSDEFGNRFDDRTYTHLMTSNKKLKKIDHATLLFRETLPNGHRTLKALHVNYMSHMDPNVRQRFSSRLCPVKTDNDNGKDFSTDKRFYFKPCDDRQAPSSSNYRPQAGYQTSRRPTQWAPSDNN